MSSTPESVPDVSTADAANEAIRQYVAGRTIWSQEALAELDRLRTDWRRAARGEIMSAA
jgi:hypothetical protein